MALIESISVELDTRAFIWGGWMPDVYKGRLLREHSDIDYYVIDLHRFLASLHERLFRDSWEVRKELGGYLLCATRGGVKLHLGHVEISDRVVEWKHNGVDDSIFFPVDWLGQEPIAFLGVHVHVVKPELGYVLKTSPGLMNPEWTWRDKDQTDIEMLRALLLAKGVDVESLRPHVRAV
jgi:hypothetical protein